MKNYFLKFVLSAFVVIIGYYCGYLDGHRDGIKQEREKAIKAGVGKYQPNIIDGKIHFRYGNFR